MARVDLTFRNYKHPDFYLEQVPLTVTVGQVKSKLSEMYPEQPAASRQRIIFMGKILADHSSLAEVFSHLTPLQLESPQNLHLVVAPPPAMQNPPTFPMQQPHNQQHPAAFLQPHDQLQHPVPGAVPPQGAPAALNQGQYEQLVEPARPHPPRDNTMLMIKLAVAIFILSQGGSTTRVVILTILGLLVYLYQTGRLQIAGHFEMHHGANPQAPGGQQAHVPAHTTTPQFTPRPRGLVDGTVRLIAAFFASLLPSWTPPPPLEPLAPQQPPHVALDADQQRVVDHPHHE
mmetsp:Transcript_52495/g.132039  ORF Transcript_52495/g.132039 Transcript_52495/m.132039 type:complete len:288 (-) Transcript_52495:79-942(-)